MKKIDLTEWSLPAIDEDAPAIWQKHLRAAVEEVLQIIVQDIEQDREDSTPWFTLEALWHQPDAMPLNIAPLTLRLNTWLGNDYSREPLYLWEGDLSQVLRHALDMSDEGDAPRPLRAAARELRALATQFDHRAITCAFEGVSNMSQERADMVAAIFEKRTGMTWAQLGELRPDDVSPEIAAVLDWLCAADDQEVRDAHAKEVSHAQ